MFVLLQLSNDLTIGWQNLNLLSHPNATQAPQARQARASGEILNYSMSRYSDILCMIIGFNSFFLIFTSSTGLVGVSQLTKKQEIM